MVALPFDECCFSLNVKCPNNRDSPHMIKFIIRIYPDMIAVICGILILPWILGVPGQPTQAVLSGWTIGLIAMGIYLLIYQTVKSLRTFEFYKKNSAFHRPVFAILNGTALCVLPVMLFSFLLIFYSE